MPLVLTTAKPVWSARMAFTLVRFAAIATAMALALTRFGLVGFIPGLVAIAAGLAVAVLSLGFAAAAAIRVWRTGEPGAGRTAWAVILAVLILAVPVAYLARGATAPMLTDIATDLEAPPVFVAASAERPSDANPLARSPADDALQRERYPAIRPLLVELPREDARAAVLTLVRERGWRLIADGADNGLIEAVEQTLLLGAKDDIAIRLVEQPDGRTRVDMRSASRYGENDQGMNAARIEAFLEELRLRALVR